MTTDDAPVRLTWIAPGDDTAELAAFFVAHVDTSYISHGEIFCGRATGPDAWVPELLAVIRAELDEIVAGDPNDKRAFVARQSGILVGMGIVALRITARAPYAQLEDVVVDSARRGCGLGKQILATLVDWLRDLGARSLFLESGIHNESAHKFFLDANFTTVSVVMRKEI